MKKNGNGRGWMSQGQFVDLKKIIEGEINKISPALEGQLSTQRAQEKVVVSDDCSQYFHALEQAAAMLSRNSRRLKELTEALKRLMTGTYGYCIECENPIGFKRLKVVPTAVHCVDCLKSLESNTPQLVR